MQFKEMDRRTFLRIGSGFLGGIATGVVLPPLNLAVNENVKQITGKQSGNVQMAEAIKEYCETKGDLTECAQNVVKKQELFISVIAPILEESAFRVLPSVMLSAVNDEDPVSVAAVGTGGILLSKRELGVGVLTSILFGGLHNITSKGYDNETIPAPGIITGMVLWILQRKFGLFANTAAHITNNTIAVQIIKNYRP